MTFLNTLQQLTQDDRNTLLSASIIHRRLQQDINVNDYVGFLMQAYHHVKHTVPLLRAVGSRLPNDIADEFETALSLQTRYRYSRAFEPALELYAGPGTLGIGPVILVNANIGVRKSITWEAGLILGIDSQTPDRTFRFLLEYEF
jgi:hypothetical protein